MAQKPDPSDIVAFRDLLVSTSIHLDTITQLLIDKGIFSSDEYYAKLKQVQTDYMRKQQ